MGIEVLEGAGTIINTVMVAFFALLGILGVLIAQRAWRESKRRAGKRIDKFTGPEQ